MARKRHSDKGRKKQSGRRRPPPNKTARKDGLFEIAVHAMANGGYALGKHDGRMTFIPYAIPGERLQARLIEQKRSIDFAAGVALLDASADRVYPQCPHFGPGRCWGCQWQHIDYRAQLLLKQDVLADQLYRLGKFDDATLARALQPVVPSTQTWHYNYHTTLIRNKHGQFGYYQVDGRTIEVIDVCHVNHPDLQALFTMIDIDFDALERLQLWLGHGDETMIVLEMNSETVPELSADFPTSVNVILPDNEPANLVGNSMIHYQVGGRMFRVTVGGMFRAHVAQIDALIAEVLRLLALSERDTVLDLYAGVGTFSAFIARRAALVTLVESYPPTATDAEANLADFDNVDIVEGRVEDVLLSMRDTGAHYDAAVLDPPSSGLSGAAIQALCDLAIPKLVYVSSDVASLARDAQALVKQGYQLQKVQAIDFAPQTYYIDAVALLTKV